MKLMRKSDPLQQEEGFHALLPHAREFLPQLMSEFRTEGRNGKDHGLQCWLLDLIGEAQSPEALPLLVEHLLHQDESFRSWAIDGLKKLDTKLARQILWELENGKVCQIKPFVRAWGWQDSMRGIDFIMIVRRYTKINLIAAKAYLDKVIAGEKIDMYSTYPEEANYFAEQLKHIETPENIELHTDVRYLDYICPR